MKWTKNTDTLHSGEGRRGGYTLEWHSFAWTASSPDSDEMIGFGTLERCKQAADRHNEEEPAGMTDEELLRRAVTAVRPANSRGYQPKWTAVMYAFMCGSTTAKELCKRFDLDPDELIRR